MDCAYKKYEPLFGSWYITEQIGHGAEGQLFRIRRENEFGDVYHAALKAVTIPGDEEAIGALLDKGVLEEDLEAYYDDMISRALKEHRMLYRLKGNSNIVSYEDHMVIRHEDDPGCDILMRIEELTPLTDYVRDEPPTPEMVAKIGADICRGLSFCRKHGIIHRDIKPENLFVSDSGDFKLGDFGIAQILEYTATALSRKGTYTFMAPEVYRGEEYGASVDIYSLGLVMYKYLNHGRGPFLPPYPERFTSEDEDIALAKRISGKPLPMPAEGPEMLKSIVMKACCFDTAKRYQTAEEMQADLEAFLRGEEYEISMAEDGEDGAKAAGKGKRGRRIIAAVIAVLVIAGVYYAMIPKEVTAVEGIDDTETIYIGDELTPEYTVEPSRFSDEEIEFVSGDESVFIVDDEGKIESVGTGEATLTISVKGYTKEVEITVKPKVTSIGNVEKSIAMETGDTMQLRPVLGPEKYADEKITYSSKDPSVVKVSKSGKLTAVSEGKTKITISAGGCKKTVTVEVTSAYEPSDSGSYGNSGSSNSSGNSNSGSSSNSGSHKNGSGNSGSSGSSSDEGYFDSNDDEYEE